MLGHTVVDKVTGFTGVVTGIVEYLTGCNQALVVPRMDADGKLPESQWFDIQRLQVDDSKAPISLENGNTPGFDRAPPKR